MQRANRLCMRLGVWEFGAGPGRHRLKGKMGWVEELESLSLGSYGEQDSVPVKKGFWAGEGHLPKFRFFPGDCS